MGREKRGHGAFQRLFLFILKKKKKKKRQFSAAGGIRPPWRKFSWRSCRSQFILLGQKARFGAEVWGCSFDPSWALTKRAEGRAEPNDPSLLSDYNPAFIGARCTLTAWWSGLLDLWGARRELVRIFPGSTFKHLHPPLACSPCQFENSPFLHPLSLGGGSPPRSL